MVNMSTRIVVNPNLAPITTARLRAIDFFCGAGGVTCGFKQANIDVLGGIDIDVTCKDTYEKNNQTKFLNKDVSAVDRDILTKEFNIAKYDDTLIFVGCSPCQYYTNLKTDKRKSRKSRLLLEDFQEFVDYYRPGYIFIENVPGLEKKRGTPLTRFKKFLTEVGYKFDDGILNAKYYGVPQNRRRYVLIASRVADSISLPLANKKDVVSVRKAIGDKTLFPKIKAGHNDESDFIHSAANLSEKNLRRLRLTPKNGGSRKAWSKIRSLQLDCYKKHDGHTDVYGRMFWSQPSPAITTRFCSISNGRYAHPVQNRAISLREGATLQSFPLDYKFYASGQGAISTMIGNAVPPTLARKIGEQLINSISTNGKIQS
jgi:DNA (cytosine-5)-methyltransferase 1